jgi:hypothetical protein
MEGVYGQFARAKRRRRLFYRSVATIRTPVA